MEHKPLTVLADHMVAANGVEIIGCTTVENGRNK